MVFISAIVLAAGESRRMGKPKQLLPLGSRTILEQVIDNLLSSKVSEVIVVLGYRAEEIRKRLSGKSVRFVINHDYQQGMSSSIVAGLKSVDMKTKAAMLVLGDQPFIGSDTINCFIDIFNSHDRGIVVPVYQGKRGHPVIFSIKYRDELLGLTGDTGAKKVIASHESDVLEITVASECVCRDIDTISDYDSSLDIHKNIAQK